MSFMLSNVTSFSVVVVCVDPSGVCVVCVSLYIPFSICVGSVVFIELIVPFPISPCVLFPQLQIVPSCFSASECICPASIFSFTFLFSAMTFITTRVSSSVPFAVTVIYALPSPVAVTFPVVSSTFATVSSDDLYVNPLFSISSNNRLNPYTVVGFI